MENKLTKNDYIKLHGKILQKAVDGIKVTNMLDYSYYKQICKLKFNIFGKIKKISIKKYRYFSEGAFENTNRKTSASRSVNFRVAREMNDLTQRAYCGDKIAATQIGLSDKIY